MTATVELNDVDKPADSSFYEDVYTIRLTKEPVGQVAINVNSVAVATDYPSVFTPDGRDFTKRKQVLVNGVETATITFDATNWTDEVTVAVTAINDNIEEGLDLLNFASQPSNLVSPCVTLLIVSSQEWRIFS